MALNLRGIVPPVITPFKDDEVDLAAYKANLEKWNQTKLSGFLVVGSNGEAAYLDEKEREEILALAKQTVAPDKFIMAGTGAESTKATIEQSKRAAELGADCALCVTPNYYKSQMTPARLSMHYKKVADASPIPILVYNFPQATGLNMSPELVAEMAGHGNIAGIKDSSGNIAQFSEIKRQTAGMDFAVFMGNAEVFFPALCLGAVGGILAVANVLPDYCADMQAACEAGDYANARAMQFNYTKLAAMVTRMHGVGGLKIVMEQAGFVPGTVRSPLTMPTPEVAEQLVAEYKRVISS